MAEPTEGVKFDQGKPRLELIPAPALIEVALVLDFGARKYGDYNWAKGIKWTRVIGAMLRHAFAYLRGEDLDPESGLPHPAHIIANALFLLTYRRTCPELDDRYKEL